MDRKSSRPRQSAREQLKNLPGISSKAYTGLNLPSYSPRSINSSYQRTSRSSTSSNHPRFRSPWWSLKSDQSSRFSSLRGLSSSLSYNYRDGTFSDIEGRLWTPSYLQHTSFIHSPKNRSNTKSSSTQILDGTSKKVFPVLESMRQPSDNQITRSWVWSKPVASAMNSGTSNDQQLLQRRFSDFMHSPYLEKKTLPMSEGKTTLEIQRNNYKCEIWLKSNNNIS